jgi:hypothetical protein
VAVGFAAAPIAGERRDIPHRQEVHVQMALSLDELDSQAVEALPAREVMSSIGSTYWGPSNNVYMGGILNGLNIQDVLNTELSLNVLNIANGIVDGGDTIIVG